MKLNIDGISNKEISKHLAQQKYIFEITPRGWVGGVGWGATIICRGGGVQNEFNLVKIQLFFSSSDNAYFDLYNCWQLIIKVVHAGRGPMFKMS